MAMELINRKHIEINKNRHRTDVPFFKIARKAVVYFSAGAVFKFKLSHGSYIHFQNDENKWFFYCNNDPDGFKLTFTSKNCAIICDTSLVTLMLKRTLCSMRTKFHIKETKAKFQNNDIFEIDFNKPLLINSQNKLRKAV